MQVKTLIAALALTAVGFAQAASAATPVAAPHAKHVALKHAAAPTKHHVASKKVVKHHVKVVHHPATHAHKLTHAA